jgi:hypothetical protein
MHYSSPPAEQAAAIAQGAPPSSKVASAPQRGVTSFPASFFAGEAPANAYDIVSRLPGFTLDLGAAARGLSDAAGNVLIDGGRPVAKGDRLDEILKRIPANAVARIDVIQGGAPGH